MTNTPPAPAKHGRALFPQLSQADIDKAESLAAVTYRLPPPAPTALKLAQAYFDDPMHATDTAPLWILEAHFQRCLDAPAFPDPRTVEAVVAWQPIETAPFEEYVWVCRPGSVHPVYAAQDESEPGDWCSFNGYYEYDYSKGKMTRTGRKLQPTLWMRSPPIPKATETSDV